MVVAALNGKSRTLTAEQQSALVSFVTLWNQSGRDPLKQPFAKEFFSKAERFSIESLARAWRLELVPESPFRDDAGGAGWFIHPTYDDLAVSYAAALLTHPLRWKLSDAPCERAKCGKWFIKKRLNPKYNTCSKYCRDIVRADEANKQQRKTEKNDKLDLAKSLVCKWEKLSPRGKRKFKDWKEFVAWKSKKNANVEVLTKKFITRAVTKEELKPPKGEK